MYNFETNQFYQVHIIENYTESTNVYEMKF